MPRREVDDLKASSPYNSFKVRPDYVFVGNEVRAKFESDVALYYVSRIIEVHDDGTAFVHYKDGDEGTVLWEHIKPLPCIDPVSHCRHIPFVTCQYAKGYPCLFMSAYTNFALCGFRLSFPSSRGPWPI